MKRIENKAYDAIIENELTKEFPEEKSDVILWWRKQEGAWYLNCMTGKSGYNLDEVKRYSDRNIFWKKGKALEGFYIAKRKTAEDEEVLIVGTCYFPTSRIPRFGVERWHHTSAWVITKNIEAYSCSHYETFSEIQNLTDITSREPSFFEGNSLESYLGYSTYTANLLIEFFGFEAFSRRMYCTHFSERKAVSDIVMSQAVSTSEKKQAVVDELTKNKLGKLLSKKQESIVFNIMHTVNGLCEKNGNYIAYPTSKDFCVMQKTGTTAVARIFKVTPKIEKLMFEEERTAEGIDDYYVSEYARIYVAENEIINCQLDKKWKYVRKNTANSSFRFILLPWIKSNVEGTRAQYFNNILCETKKVLKDFSKQKERADIYPSLSKAMKVGMKLHVMLESDMSESFINAGYGNMLRYAFYDIDYSRPKDFMETMFGGIDKKEKSLTKAIGVPSFMLQEVDDRIGKVFTSLWPNAITHHTAQRIKQLKQWYKTCPDYLARMNKDMFNKILDILDEFADRRYDTDKQITCINYDTTMMYYLNEIMSCLVEMYGPSYTISYLDYLGITLKNLYIEAYKTESSSQNGCINVRNHAGYSNWRQREEALRVFTNYKDYINMSYEIKSQIAPADWKLKTISDINRMHDNILSAYNMHKNEEEFRRNAEQFNKVKKKLESLTYSEDEFSIIAPEKTDDIANEGLSLHHCVRTYIGAVLAGTTKILFVRRTDDLSKPFYTLEIKEGMVRQCHGFGNRNTCEEKGLDEFLMRYCKEKNIQYSEGNRVLCVN